MYQNNPGTKSLSIVTIFVLSFFIFLTINCLYAKDKIMLTLSSTAFTEGDAIPLKYTCEGDDVSPSLKWDGVPDDASSLVLIVDDPDAPDPEAPKMTWVHWVLYNIPLDAKGLPESVISGALPSGTEEGLNDWGKTGYGGPCPPIGRHRYFHKLYALDTVLKGLNNPNKSQVEKAMDGHIIASTELIGTYKKAK